MTQERAVLILMRERVKLSAYIWSFLRNEHVAEDVFQEVSMALLGHIDEIGDEEHLIRWLRQAAGSA
jgi:DNA-directed RNA polymerase specialized sigma24 family protein